MARSAPFPCATATERAFGRQTMTTGMPIESSPVTFATRVMPITGAYLQARSTVCSGGTVRWVPARKSLGAVSPLACGTTAG